MAVPLHRPILGTICRPLYHRINVPVRPFSITASRCVKDAGLPEIRQRSTQSIKTQSDKMEMPSDVGLLPRMFLWDRHTESTLIGGFTQKHLSNLSSRISHQYF